MQDEAPTAISPEWLRGLQVDPLTIQDGDLIVLKASFRVSDAALLFRNGATGYWPHPDWEGD